MLCRRTQHMDQNTKIPHACEVNIMILTSRVISVRIQTYGAMITLAPGVGSEPTFSIVSGTWASQPSSWRAKVSELAEYHDPECEGCREAILEVTGSCGVVESASEVAQ